MATGLIELHSTNTTTPTPATDRAPQQIPQQLQQIMAVLQQHQTNPMESQQQIYNQLKAILLLNQVRLPQQTSQHHIQPQLQPIGGLPKSGQQRPRNVIPRPPSPPRNVVPPPPLPPKNVLPPPPSPPRNYMPPQRSNVLPPPPSPPRNFMPPQQSNVIPPPPSPPRKVIPPPPSPPRNGMPQREGQSSNKVRKDITTRKHAELQHEVITLKETVEEMLQQQIDDARRTVSDNLRKNNTTTGKKVKTSTCTPTAKPTNSALPSTNTSSTLSHPMESNGTGVIKGTRKKKQDCILDYSDDEASINDGVDYTLEENYAVKKFIGHRHIVKKKKGKETQLITRWKGWREKHSITYEPLENMVQDWPNEVRQYCNKNQEIRDICLKEYHFLFE